MKRLIVALIVALIVVFIAIAILFNIQESDLPVATKNAWEFIKIMLYPAIALFNILKLLF